MSQSSYAFITVTVDEGIGTLTFNRPDVRNAMHLPMNQEVMAALQLLGDHPDLTALVLTGAGGRAFVSGADIGELRAREGAVALARHNARLCDAIEAFPYPTIAAVEGYALGGGCEIALACDMRVASRGAHFGQPEVGLGIIPAAGGTWRLPRVVGMPLAKELIYTARIVGAEDALKMGLINHMAEDGQALDRALALAKEVAGQSRMALRLAKIAIDEGRESSRATGQALEALAQTILYDDPDKARRMDAFLEARRRHRATTNSEKNDG